MLYLIYRKEVEKLKDKIKELIEVVEELEKLVIKIISLVGWILILIYLLK